MTIGGQFYFTIYTKTGDDSRAIKHIKGNSQSVDRKISRRRDWGITEGCSSFW